MVASVFVNQVLSQCSRHCYYSKHDVTIDAYWPSLTPPASLCVTHEMTLLVHLTSTYRPHLNENNRVKSAANTTLGSLGRMIDCANYRGYVITRDINLVDCTQPQTTSILQISTSSVNVNSTSSLMSVTKSKDIHETTNAPSQSEFGRNKSSTSLLPRTEKTSIFVASLLLSTKQTSVVQSLTSKTAPLSLLLSPSISITSVSEVQVAIQLTPVYTSISPEVDPTIVSTVSKSVKVPKIPADKEDRINIDYWFVAFLAGVIVVCVVLVLISAIVCMILHQKRRQDKQHLPSVNSANTSNR